MVGPVGICQLSRCIRQLLGQVCRGSAVAALQHSCYRNPVPVLQRPQPGVTGVLPGAGVGQIEHIPQAQPVARIVQQGDALGPAPDIAVHPVIPDIVRRAGGGVGALGIDHKLVGVGVLVQPAGCRQKARPALPVSGQAAGGVLGELRVVECFLRHFASLRYSRPLSLCLRGGLITVSLGRDSLSSFSTDFLAIGLRGCFQRLKATSFGSIAPGS